jgi:hypothetical protein
MGLVFPLATFSAVGHIVGSRPLFSQPVMSRNVHLLSWRYGRLMVARSVSQFLYPIPEVVGRVCV